MIWNFHEVQRCARIPLLCTHELLKSPCLVEIGTSDQKLQRRYERNGSCWWQTMSYGETPFFVGHHSPVYRALQYAVWENLWSPHQTWVCRQCTRAAPTLQNLLSIMSQEVLECFKCIAKLEYAITQTPGTASTTLEWSEHQEQEVLERLMYAQMQCQTWVCHPLKLQGQFR